MYVPSHFDEQDSELLAMIVDQHPLATLITTLGDGIEANHLPLILENGLGAGGVLTGHVPRANQISGIIEPLDALAIFHGPDAYVSPNWYPTKQQHGRAVPTWNYAVVHIHGRLRIVDDAEWVSRQVETLTQRFERRFDQPWSVSDAPAEYVEKLLAMVVGVEVAITRVVGKLKASQNQPAANRQGVVDGLRSHPEEPKSDMADLVHRNKTSI